VWDLGRARYDWLTPALVPIDRTVTLAEVLPQQRRLGIGGVVLVQAADNPEDTAHLLEVAQSSPQVVGVVAYLPLDRPRQVAADLAEFVRQPVVVGIRTLIHELADPDFLLRDAVQDSLAQIAAAGLCFDVVSALPRHLEHVPVLARRHPELRLVVDHLSRPPIGARSVEPWWTLIERAAEPPNVSAKISGLYPDADRSAWSTEEIRPFVQRALAVFGPRRLMYGGDWPMSVLAGGYEHVWTGLAPLFAELDEADRAQVLQHTASRVYRLDPDRLAAAARALADAG
jgi:L-fuconolactonase